MARNASGTMSNINSPPVTHTAITVARANAWESDVVTEISDSLSRSGKGGMTAPLRGADGTLAAPALSFTSETGTGLFRNAAGDLRLTVLGVLRSFWNSTGHKVISAVADGASAVAHIFDSTTNLANASAKLVSFQNATVEKAAIGQGGNVLAPEYHPLAAGAAVVKGDAADGATAVGVTLDNSVALANAAAKLVNVKNAGVEKFALDLNGEPSISSGFACGVGVKTDADQTDSTGGGATITNMSFPVVANGVYAFEAWGGISASGGGSGMTYSLTGPAAPTAVSVTGWTVSQGSNFSSYAAAFGNLSGNVTPVATGISNIRGSIVNGANAGTVAIGFAWISVGTSVTAKKGWFLRWRRIG